MKIDENKLKSFLEEKLGIKIESIEFEVGEEDVGVDIFVAGSELPEAVMVSLDEIKNL